MVKNYRIIEHTADIGIHVKGKNLKDLFQNAGLAIFEISSERINQKKGKIKTIRIAQKALDLDELFVNWVNELLSFSASKGIIFEKIKINRIGETAIEAVVSGSSIKNYKVNTEIKAATYHQLKINKNTSGWQAEVIFDV